jgi:hypothetical protein
MRSRLVLSAFMVIALICVAPVVHAQNSELGVGPIPPMGNPILPMSNPVLPMSNPVLPMGSSPVTGFGVMPTPFVSSPPASVPVPQFVLRPTPSRETGRGGGGTNGPVTVTPGTTSAPARGNPSNRPSAAGGKPTNGNTAGAAAETDKTPSHPNGTFTLGTPRSQVIQKLGSPLTVVSTLNGETLYYSGDVTVFIQNGVVAKPR